MTDRPNLPRTRSVQSIAESEGQRRAALPLKLRGRKRVQRYQICLRVASHVCRVQGRLSITAGSILAAQVFRRRHADDSVTVGLPGHGEPNLSCLRALHDLVRALKRVSPTRLRACLRYRGIGSEMRRRRAGYAEYDRSSPCAGTRAAHGETRDERSSR